MSAPEGNPTEETLSLARFTSPELLLPSLSGATPAAAISELSQLLVARGDVPNGPEFAARALEREALSSTAAQPGFALPHVRVTYLDRPRFALGRTAAPMPWLANSPNLVQLIFLIVVPQNNVRLYITFISGVARLSKDSERLNRLLKAGNCGQMFEILSEITLKAK